MGVKGQRRGQNQLLDQSSFPLYFTLSPLLSHFQVTKKEGLLWWLSLGWIRDFQPGKLTEFL
jgi:hypothetical protein